MKNNKKITGLLMGLAIIALSIGNAATSYGIKGNTNLSLVVLADGTGSSGSGSGSGSGSDSSEKIYKYVKENEEELEDKGELSPDGKKMYLYFDGVAYDLTCKEGNVMVTCTDQHIEDWDRVQIITLKN